MGRHHSSRNRYGTRTNRISLRELDTVDQDNPFKERNSDAGTRNLNPYVKMLT